ncbi:MAG: translation initiation factor IF-2 subunit gamma [Candidatus Woesearchaeota archaeon]|jgi:translation initiation factor 2 subunit 3|nr:translation initiation factor IF-2 subunit gamma [Candidatus Woesearchaeota archaeon]MDP7506453.1 translation initiation factor IF-2 subunit gamma [Candidatus Woesearchaeota archaeon]MDP7610395.1 translation initiation factor IF-2 subunit gamma [Candidatus Woesearchaeota archaeon]|tara:strand:+ start:4228 stop:5466 length:1239 start_codon:yes stop_codon:yes gene_type:complete
MTVKQKQEEIQPEINIGLIGHVDHGKTTLLEALSGKWAATHSEELKKGITIRLGYADAVFRKCAKCKIFTTKDKCEKCKGKAKFIRKVSFVDAPGHESLMATMLSGATLMDGALLLVAANEDCPQPQTREHIMALEIIGIKNIVIVQNKVDLVDDAQAKKNYKEIKNFISNTIYKDAPIVPISAVHKVNIRPLIEVIEKTIKTPKRDSKETPLMVVARSFDINKPGIKPKDITGGVLGGSLKRGVLKVGQEIEIKPGRITEEKNQTVNKPIIAKITGLKSGGASVKDVKPGGTIGILTSLDPSIVKSDYLTGSVVGLKGKLPDVWYEFEIEPHLLERVVGSKEELKVSPVKLGELLMLNVNSTATVGQVVKFVKKKIKCKLKIPVCTEVGSRVTISRRIGNRFRLIGYGIIH